MNSRTSLRDLGLAALLVICGIQSAEAQGPKAGAEMVFGMSTVLSGPAANLGLEMRTGVLAAFAELEGAKPLQGRSLRLIALDDGYEPDRTVPNMRQLIETDKVLGIIGNVGTPTAIAAIPIANAEGVPFYGAFTGAGVLRKSPPDRFVVNFRASYAEETAAMVDALITGAGLRVQDIAFFTQRDGYGDAGYSGGLAALRRHGLKDEHQIAHGRYERNTTAIEAGLAEILQKNLPRAVIMVGAYAPCAEFIKQAVASELDAVFLNVSFVGSASLASALKETRARVVITQVVPHFQSDLPLVKQYREALGRHDAAAKPSFGSLEGYVAARILALALEKKTGTVDREGVIDAFESLGKFDIGLGVPLELSPVSHQASHTIWPTIIEDGRIVPFDWKDLPKLAGEARESK